MLKLAVQTDILFSNKSKNQMHQSLRFIARRLDTVQHLYPFSVHVVTFTFHYQLMHLLIKNTFTVHI
jgi:hypothetical protein